MRNEIAKLAELLTKTRGKVVSPPFHYGEEARGEGGGGKLRDTQSPVLVGFGPVQRGMMYDFGSNNYLPPTSQHRDIRRRAELFCLSYFISHDVAASASFTFDAKKLPEFFGWKEKPFESAQTNVRLYFGWEEMIFEVLLL